MRRALLAALAAIPSLALAQPREASLRIANRTAVAVVEVNASPASDAQWRHNRLGADTIRPGAAQLIRLPPTADCLHDVRVVFADGRTEQRQGVDVCRAAEIVLTGAPPPQAQRPPDNPSFNLVNQTPARIASVFASPSNFPDWGPNHLGRAPLDPGAVFPLRLPLGQCLYDLRVVFDGGAAREWRDMDTCRVTNLVLR